MSPAVALGLDAVCWDDDLSTGRLSLREVVDECAELGAPILQVNLRYLDDRDDAPPPEALAAHAAERGVALRAIGGPLARRFHADARAAAEAARRDLRRARALGSPWVMSYSGVYRPDLAGRPGEAAAELAHLRAVLELAGPGAAQDGTTLLLENASDFTAAELLTVLEPRIEGTGAFVDLTNPTNVFEDASQAIGLLAPLAQAAHVKDFVLASIWEPGQRYRHGFELRFRYPGEGVGDVEGRVAALLAAATGPVELIVEGLAPHRDRTHRRARLKASLDLLRELVARDAGAGAAG